MDEETKARRFEDGLRFRIKQGVVPFELTTFRVVVSKTLLVEMGLNEAQADRDNNQKKRPRQREQSSSFQTKKQGTQRVDTKALPKCSRCGGLMQIRIATRILEHVSHVDKKVIGLLSVPN